MVIQQGTSVAWTPLELFEVYRRHRFPPAVAITMGAVALRESRGIPTAYNGPADLIGKNATGDRSYGHAQVNLGDLLVFNLISEKILKGRPESLLFDPEWNAEAAFLLWGWANQNLNTAWYIAHTDGTYRAEWRSYLPAMVEASLASAYCWKDPAFWTPTPAQLV